MASKEKKCGVWLTDEELDLAIGSLGYLYNTHDSNHKEDANKVKQLQKDLIALKDEFKKGGGLSFEDLQTHQQRVQEGESWKDGDADRRKAEPETAIVWKDDSYDVVTNEMFDEYPDTMNDFLKINYEQICLFARKQKDYGPGNIAMNGDRNLALMGLGVRMNDKTQRILNLVWNKKDAENESLVDSFRDLSVYGIIAQIVLNDNWGK